MLDLQRLLPPFNPWWANAKTAFEDIPHFKRLIFADLKADIHALPQIISLTGPRRVGKTTILHQLIQDLIDRGVNPRRIVYYSMDDPALLLNTQSEINGFIEEAMQRTRESSEEWYFFLDEIQRLEGWELYLKKYYDLKYPVRFIISGSASSPIFKKSRESLLGRIKDYHLLPFSFREFALFRTTGTSFSEELITLANSEDAHSGSIPNSFPASHAVPEVSPTLKRELERLLAIYFHEGGFPEVWQLPTLVAKLDYLFDNQVRKVIDEDLVLAVELRKPELLKQFYLSLLAIPGAEKNIEEISRETRIRSEQIEKYLPLLEMTDLLFHVSKFRAGSLKVRKGNMKFYVSDLALRNAVLRISPDALMSDANTLGRYAENLVFLALHGMRASLEIDFYREKNEEIDFIVHAGEGKYLPIEVKYRSTLEPRTFTILTRFARKHPSPGLPIIVTKNWRDAGVRDGVLLWPLPLFLLWFR